jgi:hypothetical protein
MREAQKRRIVAGIMTVAAAVIVSGSAVPASTADDAREPQQARAAAVFRLSFDNGESLRPGTRALDTTGHRHHATVVVSDGGRLTRERGVVRRAAGFPSACGTCGRALLEIMDRAAALDPRRRDFQFGASVRVTPRQAPDGLGLDPNLVQKGLYNERGGQFKLELLGSRPRCVIAGRKGRVTTPRGESIADGRWHSVQCVRRGPVVKVRVDGRTVAEASGPTGWLASSAPVRIGGKAVGSAGQNDQFHGDLDSVFLTFLR